MGAANRISACRVLLGQGDVSEQSDGEFVEKLTNALGRVRESGENTEERKEG